MINVGIIGLGYWGPNIVRNCVNIEGITPYQVKNGTN